MKIRGKEKKTYLTLTVLLTLLAFFLANCAQKEGEKKIVLRYAGSAYPKYDQFRKEEAKKFS